MESFFLDTNIFVYAFLASEPRKRQRALELIEQALATRQGGISYQVIQEFTNVARKKFAQRASPAECTAFIAAAMQPLPCVQSSTAMVMEALALHEQTRYGFYDCLILQAAQQSGAQVLYTEDLQHGQLVGDVRIVNPFLLTANEPTPA